MFFSHSEILPVLYEKVKGNVEKKLNLCGFFGESIMIGDYISQIIK